MNANEEFNGRPLVFHVFAMLDRTSVMMLIRAAITSRKDTSRA